MKNRFRPFAWRPNWFKKIKNLFSCLSTKFRNNAKASSDFEHLFCRCYKNGANMRKTCNSSYKGRPWIRPITHTPMRPFRPNPLGLNSPLPLKLNQPSRRPCGSRPHRPPPTRATGCGAKKAGAPDSVPIPGGAPIGRAVTLPIATPITTAGLVIMGTTSPSPHRPPKCHQTPAAVYPIPPVPTGSPNNKACRPFDPRPTDPHRVPPEILVPRSLHPTESPLRRALSDPHTTAHLPPTEPPTWVATLHAAHWVGHEATPNITVSLTVSSNSLHHRSKPNLPASLITRVTTNQPRLIFLSSWTSWQHNNPRFKINTPIWNRYIVSIFFLGFEQPIRLE